MQMSCGQVQWDTEGILGYGGHQGHVSRHRGHAHRYEGHGWQILWVCMPIYSPVRSPDHSPTCFPAHWHTHCRFACPHAHPLACPPTSVGEVRSQTNWDPVWTGPNPMVPVPVWDFPKNMGPLGLQSGQSYIA